MLDIRKDFFSQRQWTPEVAAQRNGSHFIPGSVHKKHINVVLEDMV